MTRNRWMGVDRTRQTKLGRGGSIHHPACSISVWQIFTGKRKGDSLTVTSVKAPEYQPEVTAISVIQVNKGKGKPLTGWCPPSHPIGGKFSFILRTGLLFFLSPGGDGGQ